MQKIIIKNFGPVKDAEIEIKKVLVLIGEQASGKSTIAKLIYFFKSFIKDVLYSVYQSTEDRDFDIEKGLVTLAKEKFHTFFGSPSSLPNSEIKFYYSFEKDKYLKLEIDTNKYLSFQASKNLFEDEFSSLNTNFKDLFNKTKKLFTLIIKDHFRKLTLTKKINLFIINKT